MKKTTKGKVAKKTTKGGKQKKGKTEKLPWTTEDIKKYCEEAGFRIVTNTGPAVANSDAKELWNQGNTYFPPGASKGVKI